MNEKVESCSESRILTIRCRVIVLAQRWTKRCDEQLQICWQ